MSSRNRFVCRECGQAAPQWMGRCAGCGEWNSIEEVESAPPGKRKARGPAVTTRTLGEIESLPNPRYRSGLQELDRVLGGGLVPGSLILVAGDPGVGKSTLLLAAASAYAGQGLRALYVAAEESESQIRLRSRRLGSIDDGIRILASSRMDAVASVVEAGDADVIIVDSVQTLSLGEGAASPGSVAQVRDVTLYFMELAKRTQIPVVVLVGHVTKEGTVAGPRVMEHLVDAVLTLEGDRDHATRLLRSSKNRFGPTHETGVFEMAEDGLREVRNPSALLLEERQEDAPGSVVMVALEGTRPLLLEIQALVGSAGMGVPRRVATGVDGRRLAVLLAVLEKRAGMNVTSCDVFASVAGGFRVTEPAADLAVAMAVASSHLNRPLPAGTVVLGEVGLGGEVRRISQLERRLHEAAQLGFHRAVVPRTRGAVAVESMQVHAVARVDEALQVLEPRAASVAPIEEVRS